MVLDELRPLKSATSNRVPLRYYSSSEDPPASSPQPHPTGRNQSVDSSIWRYINGWLGRGETPRQEAKKRCQAIANRHSTALVNIKTDLESNTRCSLPENVRKSVKLTGEESNRRLSRRTNMIQVEQPTTKGNLRISRSFSLRNPIQYSTSSQRIRIPGSLRIERKREHLYRCSSELLRSSRRRFGSVFAALLIVATLLVPNLLLCPPISIEAASIPISRGDGSSSELDSLQPLFQVNDTNDPIPGDPIDELALSNLDESNEEPWYVADIQQEDVVNHKPVSIYSQGERFRESPVNELVGDDSNSDYLVDSSLPVPSDQVLAVERNKRDLVWLERRRLDRNRASEPPPWRKVLPERRDGYSTSTSGASERFKDAAAGAENRGQNRRSQRESASELYHALLSSLLEGAFSDPQLLEGVYNEIEPKIKSDERSKTSSSSSESLSPSSPPSSLSSSSSSGLSGSKNKSKKLEQLQRHLAGLVKWPLAEGDRNDVASGELEARHVDEEPEATLKIFGDELMSPEDEEKLLPLMEELSDIQQQQQPQGATYLEVDESTRQIPTSISDIRERLVEGQSYRMPEGMANNIQSASQRDINGGSAQLIDAPTPVLVAPEPQFHVLEEIDQMDNVDSQNQQLPSEMGVNMEPTKGELQLLNQWAPVPGSQQYDLSKRALWPAWLSAATTGTIAGGLSYRLSPITNNNNNNINFEGQQVQQPSVELMGQLATLLIESSYLDKDQLVEIATKLKQYLEASFGLASDSIVGLYPMSPLELLMKLDRAKVGMSSNQWSVTNSEANYESTGPLFVIAAWPKGNKQNPIPLLSAILRTLGLTKARYMQLHQLRNSGTGSSIQQSQMIASSVSGTPKTIEPLELMRTDVDGSMSLVSGSAFSRLTALAAYLKSIYSNTDSGLDTSSKSDADFLGLKISTILLVLMLALPSVLVLFTVSLWLRGKRQSWPLTRSLNGSLKSLWPRSSADNKSLPSADQLASWVSHESDLTGCGQIVGTKEKACGDEHRSESRPRGLGAAHQLAHRLHELLKGMKQASGSTNPVDNDDEADQEDEEDIESGGGDSSERLLSERARRFDMKPPPVAASGFKFRTSQSYIRSLIEALSRAGNSEGEWNGAGGGSSTANESPPQDVEETSEELAAGAGAKSSGGSVIAQMDISAAHLILDYMERHLEDKEALKKEWLEMKASSNSKLNQAALERQARVALSARNKDKNISPSVVPFDKNRIKLGWPRETWPKGQHPGSSELESYDYINASYIYDDNLRKPTHIIAQGPLEKTSGQFWQMVWEQNVSTIVMLTKLSEGPNSMCHCYWPSNASTSVPTSSTEGSQLTTNQQERRMSVTSVYTGTQNGGKPGPVSVANGDLNNNILRFKLELPVPDGKDKVRKQTWKSLEVHLVSEHVSSSDYIVRNMYLVDQSTGETRSVTQFHYLQWPQNAIPSNVKSFLEFRRKVHKSYRNLSCPILVHCSDGGARSGTYTLIDIVLERIRNGAKEIDPRATLEHLADQRPGLCGSQCQFEFVLLALAEEIQIILQALPQ